MVTARNIIHHGHHTLSVIVQHITESFYFIYLFFWSSLQPGLRLAGHWILFMQCKRVHVQLPDEAECAAGKGITSGRPSHWQRA